jgi:antitoxin (DNA-binding transcriptional repressor) of toxin-antitoxin stability system
LTGSVRASRSQALRTQRQPVDPALDYVATCSHNDPDEAVGIRELKNKLSEYLRQVKAGEEILVTDRGDVVAELHAPVDRRGGVGHPELRRMARQGRVRLGAPNDPEAYPDMPPLLSTAEILELLDASRGDH